MGILVALGGAIGGTFADQWKDIITAGPFDEHVVVSPGVLKGTDNGRGSNYHGSEGVISNGSKIFVPENTAAFIFSQSGIENVISTPGGYEYRNGQDSVFNGDGIGSAIFKQIGDRIGYGGITDDYKQIAFVNLREIRDIKFGTHGPLMYNDLFYGTDLEIYSYGSFTVKVTDPVRFVRNFVPPNVMSYSFDDAKVRSQITGEFLQSFIVAVNSLSKEYRISELPAQANNVAQRIATDSANAGTWPSRFGFNIVKVAIENIEFSPESRELVRRFSRNRMDLRAYEGVSQQASNVAAQQRIAQGVENHGLGDVGGMLFGANLAQTINPMTGGTMPIEPVQPNQSAQSSQTSQQPAAQSAMSLTEQLDAVQKLKELLDAGILSQEEFDAKKKEILGL
ncbi:SPFH domain-containing protein [Bifidobacterium oedipodis]|uniref:Virion core protein n=1 Tax=Bifidobacterium oedipodis TaxID=2675322 RepID=A0A7Y0HSQ3_9BIFI|nr:SPFH domain-containing protein [Bifidobacterium sp. DSM 109957]NMM94261.1 virion core protein [Bifidobacterium sp. DSM 109957]